MGHQLILFPLLPTVASYPQRFHLNASFEFTLISYQILLLIWNYSQRRNDVEGCSVRLLLLTNFTVHIQDRHEDCLVGLTPGGLDQNCSKSKKFKCKLNKVKQSGTKSNQVQQSQAMSGKVEKKSNFYAGPSLTFLLKL